MDAQEALSVEGLQAAFEAKAVATEKAWRKYWELITTYREAVKRADEASMEADRLWYEAQQAFRAWKRAESLGEESYLAARAGYDADVAS